MTIETTEAKRYDTPASRAAEPIDPDEQWYMLCPFAERPDDGDNNWIGHGAFSVDVTQVNTGTRSSPLELRDGHLGPPIGEVFALEERPDGLYGRIHLHDPRRRLTGGLSVRFVPQDKKLIGDNWVHFYADLLEVARVNVPAYRAARFPAPAGYYYR